jgi:hypothetical protein
MLVMLSESEASAFQAEEKADSSAPQNDKRLGAIDTAIFR